MALPNSARHEARDDRVTVDALVIERAHGLPGRVLHLAVERLEAGEKDGFRHGAACKLCEEGSAIVDAADA